MLSQKARYALHSLIVLAERGGDQPMMIADIAEEANVPRKFLEQILLGLRNEGLLASKRGVGGGYMLKRMAGKITVGSVVRAMDGPMGPLPCAGMAGDDVPCSCPNPRTCARGNLRHPQGAPGGPRRHGGCARIPYPRLGPHPDPAHPARKLKMLAGPILAQNLIIPLNSH